MVRSRTCITFFLSLLVWVPDNPGRTSEPHIGDHVHRSYLAVEKGELRQVSEHGDPLWTNRGRLRQVPEIEQTEPTEPDHDTRISSAGFSLVSCRNSDCSWAISAARSMASPAGVTQSATIGRYRSDRIRPSPLLSRIPILLI